MSPAIAVTDRLDFPELLKLSGIGPAAELAQWGIPCIRDMPGVGVNMQDRYEVGSVGLATTPFSAFKKCTYSVLPDPCLDEFRAGLTQVSRTFLQPQGYDADDVQIDKGPYTSNGLVSRKLSLLLHAADWSPGTWNDNEHIR